MPETQRGADIRRELARREAEQAAARPIPHTPDAGSPAADNEQGRRTRPSQKES